MSEKLSLQLALVLPGVPDERDVCIQRLTDSLLAQGLEKVHVVREDGEACLCLHYDPARFGLAQVRALARAAGATISAHYQHELMRIEGMDCPTCATVIEHALGRLDGVLEASVSYAAERMRLEYDTEKVSRKAILQRLEALGYSVVEPHHEAPWHVEYRELMISAVAGALLLAGWLIGLRHAGDFVHVVLLVASLMLGGLFAMRDAWQSIRERHLDIDVLMIVAALGAAALGQWVEGALLLVLFSLGHALEHLAMDRARHAMEALADLAPKTALVLRDGVEQEVAVEDLLRGDRVLVKPGQRVPADGKVLEGRSAVDQAAITGESMPVDKSAGAMVFAGTVNGEGLLAVEVSKLAKDSSLARMVQLVAEAQTEKSPTQRFVTKVEKVFVPLVLVGVVALIVVPLAAGPAVRRELLPRDGRARCCVALRAGHRHAFGGAGRRRASRARRRPHQGRRAPGKPALAVRDCLRQDRHHHDRKARRHRRGRAAGRRGDRAGHRRQRRKPQRPSAGAGRGAGGTLSAA